MLSFDPLLTKEDFLNSHWQDVVNSSERKECRAYYRAFWNKAQEAKEAGKVKEQAVFEILAFVTHIAIEPKSIEEFFAEWFQDLTDEHLEFFKEIAPEISDPELQARVADILWCRRYPQNGYYKMAQLAVDAYLQSAIELEDLEHWTWCFDRIERAFRLAYKINYEPEKVIEHIEKILKHYDGEDPSWLSAELMGLLQENKLKDPTKYARYTSLAQKAAISAESNNDWRRARDYWEIKAKWHLMEQDSEKELAARMLAAETYVKEAENAINRTPASYLEASSHIQKAIEAFRRIRGTQEGTADAKHRAEELHKLLLQYQEKSRQELGHLSYEYNLTKKVEQARERVRGKKLQDAIFAIVLMISPVKVSHLRQEVQESARDSTLLDMMPMLITNNQGKVVAKKTGSVFSGNPDEAEAATLFEMNRYAVHYQFIKAQAYITPAIYQINLEHSVSIKDLLPIVSHNPFIPPGREYLFAKGLYAGLTGDFMTSIHILIPQIENSVRYLLSQRGVITSSLDDQGIQNEHNLNTTLYCPEITSIFDEDTLFDLKGLLVERAGSNLRNRMAHGLMNDDQFSSPLMIYLWWLTLRICCLPILNYQKQVQESDPWVKFSGMFKDDLLFDEFVEDMAAYRDELDEVNSEETQSA